jgi:hypothetical protein
MVGEGLVVAPVSLEAGLLRGVVAFAGDAGEKGSEFMSRALELLVDGAPEVGGAKVAVPKPAPRFARVAKTGKARMPT